MGRAPLQFQAKDEAGPRTVHVYFLAELSMSHPANGREAYSRSGLQLSCFGGV